MAPAGLERGPGRLDELRQFMAERALEAGDRPRFLELQFAQAADSLTQASPWLSRSCAEPRNGGYASRG